uniref:Uncharacterized protein n=1 Tax=Eutreptiella gymnastica TaxID=73025 RepID=A0A7S1I4Q4_9EUGL
MGAPELGKRKETHKIWLVGDLARYTADVHRQPSSANAAQINSRTGETGAVTSVARFLHQVTHHQQGAAWCPPSRVLQTLKYQINTVRTPSVRRTWLSSF